MAQLARVRRALYAAGWMRHGWPAEIGGLGGPAVLRAVLGEEVATRELAEPGIWSMVEVLAPTMISYAPPALAAEMAPRLLSGREQWCQGFSEPGSGSDLASLSTRAVPRGDDWVVSGQNVRTSLAQYAQRCVLLTRAAPGHAGITAFFVDMDSRGHRAATADHARRGRVRRGRRRMHPATRTRPVAHAPCPRGPTPDGLDVGRLATCSRRGQVSDPVRLLARLLPTLVITASGNAAGAGLKTPSDLPGRTGNLRVPTLPDSCNDTPERP